MFYYYYFTFSYISYLGLKKAGYINPTDIQKDCIGLALKDHDILGAAKTGSGKTLAFIIPVIIFINTYLYMNHTFKFIMLW